MHRMKKVIVIGTGNIGMRHLQALSLLESIKLYAVESDEAARVKANDVLGKTVGRCCESIHFYPSIQLLEKEENAFDLAVIAVNSNVRYAVAKQLINQVQVYNIIFEKVLFNKLSEYRAMEGLLQENGIHAWVNCPKRSYPYYQEMKKRFGFGEMPVSLRLEGNMWGIGCNTIHYVDFLAFLSNSYEQFVFDTSELDHRILDSKRKGYVEFTGTIKASSGKNMFCLISRDGTFDGLRMTIENDKYICEIEEKGAEGRNRITDKVNGSIVEEKFNVPFQSNLTNLVAQEIFETGNCPLAKFEVSMGYHIPMLKAFCDFMGIKDGICNIT